MYFEILGEISQVETLRQVPVFGKTPGCGKYTGKAVGESEKALLKSNY
jgi:hypothetical protein